MYVIARYRSTNSNLRTRLNKIIRAAGLTPWPKLFQNLRSSRSTELATEYPDYVAAAWMGHSTAVANKHYWQVTDADFDRAAALHLRSSTAPQGPENEPMKAARPVSSERSAHEKSPGFPGLAAGFESMQILGQNRPMGVIGLEPMTPTV